MVGILVNLKSLFNQYYEKVKKHIRIKQHIKIIPFILIIVALATVLYALYYCYNFISIDPINQVSQLGINNTSEKAGRQFVFD
jgi:hypothetical protein